jgi:hypothetical protein
MLISYRSAERLVTIRSVSGFALVVGFSSQIVGSRKCIRAGDVTGIGLVPRVQSVGFDGRCHGHDGCPKRLVQDVGILKCFQQGDGMDQRLKVEL